MILKLNQKYKIEPLIKIEDLSIEKISLKEIYNDDTQGPELINDCKNENWIFNQRSKI